MLYMSSGSQFFSDNGIFFLTYWTIDHSSPLGLQCHTLCRAVGFCCCKNSAALLASFYSSPGSPGSQNYSTWGLSFSLWAHGIRSWNWPLLFSSGWVAGRGNAEEPSKSPLSGSHLTHHDSNWKATTPPLNAGNLTGPIALGAQAQHAQGASSLRETECLGYPHHCALTWSHGSDTRRVYAMYILHI